MVSLIPFQEDGAGKRAEGTPPSDASTSKGEEVNAATAESSSGDGVVLDQHSGRRLPDDILEAILTRLPFFVLCPLRCVCQSWKQDLVSSSLRTSSILPCMIWSRLGGGNARVFCHAEKQWLTLPPKQFTIPSKSVFIVPWKRTEKRTLSQSSGTSWELVDVDAGLLCYRRNIEGSLWLFVSNPLTSFSRIIPPDYVHHQFEFIDNPSMLKLVVDRQKKTFKVILVVDKPMLTAVYDSTTARWLLCRHHPSQFTSDLYDDDSPGRHMDGLFVWKNVIYAYSKSPNFIRGYRTHEHVIVAFDEELGSWRSVRAKFPRERAFETNYVVLSDKDQVVLVLFSTCIRQPFVRVWKPLDDGSGPHASFLNWEQILTGSCFDWTMTRAIGRTLAGTQLGHVCYGTDYICFMFRGSQIRRGTRISIHKCVKHSFVTRKWSLLPCPSGWTEPFKLYHWQPNANVDPTSPCDEDSIITDRCPTRSSTSTAYMISKALLWLCECEDRRLALTGSDQIICV